MAVTNHPSGSEFELYVMGALPAARAAVLEAHVLSCVPCSELLQREARLEAALWEVARSAAEAPVVDLGAYRSMRQGARSFLASPAGRLTVATMALAAAAALVLVPRVAGRDDAGPSVPTEIAERPQEVLPAAHQPAPEPWQAACPDQMSLRECRAAARRHGFFVVSSAHTEEFPRYKVLTGASP